jgi:hypothetical protein
VRRVGGEVLDARADGEDRVLEVGAVVGDVVVRDDDAVGAGYALRCRTTVRAIAILRSSVPIPPGTMQ